MNETYFTIKIKQRTFTPPKSDYAQISNDNFETHEFDLTNGECIRCGLRVHYYKFIDNGGEMCSELKMSLNGDLSCKDWLIKQIIQ